MRNTNTISYLVLSKSVCKALLKITKFKLVLLLLVPFLLTNCEDFVEIDSPPTEVSSDVVFQNDNIATSALLGIYAGMFNSEAISDKNLRNALAGDELEYFLTGDQIEQFFVNSLLSDNLQVEGIWSEYYFFIFSANSILEGLEDNPNITPEVSRQIQGEAKFIRAYSYFYLTNLWGDVPLVLSTNVQENSTLSRTPQRDVYDMIIQDLIEAEQLMVEDFSFSGGDRSRPNRWAATALLARVYLYLEQWENAEQKATQLIENGSFSLATDLNQVFLANSEEAIWQLSATQDNGTNTLDANSYIILATPIFYALRNDFVNSFEVNDLRSTSWISSFSDGTSTFFYPFKYKVRIDDGMGNLSPITEYLMMFRIAEQFLIRAESRVQLGNMSGALDDLNVIRNRAGLSNIGGADMQSMLLFVEQERKVELFTEESHRWLDLNRTNRSEVLLPQIAIKNWQDTDKLYPIPANEIFDNPELTQNPGY